MSAESRRDWLMTHPTLGVAIMTTAITAFAVPFAVIALASSRANGALGVAGVSIGLGWLAGFVYGNILIRRQGAGPDWRPPTPNSGENDGEGEQRVRIRRGGKAPEPNCGRAVLKDPRFIGLAALSIAISAGYSTTGSAASVAGRLASFVVGAVCLVAFNAFLIMITLRHSTPSHEAMVRSRNSLFALAAVFLALAVFGAVTR